MCLLSCAGIRGRWFVWQLYFFVLFLNEMCEPVIKMFLKSSSFLQLPFPAANMFYIYKLWKFSWLFDVIASTAIVGLFDVYSYIQLVSMGMALVPNLFSVFSNTFPLRSEYQKQSQTAQANQCQMLNPADETVRSAFWIVKIDFFINYSYAAPLSLSHPPHHPNRTSEIDSIFWLGSFLSFGIISLTL